MAKDLGYIRAPNDAEMPAGVDDDSMFELAIRDPLTENAILGYAYMFKSDSQNQDAGKASLQYQFNLVTTTMSGSHSYFDVYKSKCDTYFGLWDCIDAVMNPEDSWFRSEYYERHFAENWISDKLMILAEGSNGQDFLGLADFQFTIDDCSRSTLSFSRGPTSFIANKVGPIRAIRSFVGANSATIAYEERKMYEQREDGKVVIQVHPLPGMFNVINFKEGSDLKFYNCRNMEGFDVDAWSMDSNEDAFDNTFCPWQLVTGPSGSYLRAINVEHDLETFFGPGAEDLEDVVSAWYYDNDSPSGVGSYGAPEFSNGWSMCSAATTGQTSAFVSNTDPMSLVFTDLPAEAEACVAYEETTLNKVTSVTNQYYLSPGFTPQQARDLFKSGLIDLTV